MAKDINSKYYPGKRSAGWTKVKVRTTIDCLIIGYTEGKGDRSGHFGAMHIAQKEGDELKYLGKVGTGWDSRKMEELYSELKQIKKINKIISEKLADDKVSTWIIPQLYCEVQYASITSAGTLREPVFIRLRPDL